MNEIVKDLLIDGNSIKCTMINDLDFGRFIVTNHIQTIKYNSFSMNRERREKIRKGDSIVFSSNKNGNIRKSFILLNDIALDVYYETILHKDFPYIYDFGISIISDIEPDSKNHLAIISELKRCGINWVPSYADIEQVYIQIPALRNLGKNTMVTTVSEYLTAVERLKNSFESEAMCFFVDKTTFYIR